MYSVYILYNTLSTIYTVYNIRDLVFICHILSICTRRSLVNVSSEGVLGIYISQTTRIRMHDTRAIGVCAVVVNRGNKSLGIGRVRV